MIAFRPYEPGDEAAITSLFCRVFGRPMSIEFWRWRFLDHPMADPMIMLAFDDEILVGHYAASQAPLNIGGAVHPAGLSVGTMTHPEWRGQKLFERTAEALYETLPSRGKKAVYGFPNTAIHALRRNKVGWDDFCDVASLVLDIGGLQSVPVADTAVRTASHIDDRFGRFFANIASTLPVSGHRDANILRWRIDHNPANTYTRLVLEEGTEIAGYAFTKPYGTEILDLVELRCSGTVAARALLNTVVANAAALGRTKISTWCLPHDDHRIALEMAGFKATAPVTYFGGRTFAPLPADLTDARLWRLSMLDSDLY
ncbi:GNAT family N-acetyltransferase [Pararhizobium sp.]|uniref:GNAT family N-acetyltransferase n=1 Tax=Pararhizobium sp. TaxID=1977563 RepID=UPI003D144FAA